MPDIPTGKKDWRHVYKKQHNHAYHKLLKRPARRGFAGPKAQ